MVISANNFYERKTLYRKNRKNFHDRKNWDFLSS